MIIEVLSPAYPLYPLNLYNRVDQLNLLGGKNEKKTQSGKILC